jgi:hypothetical protein
MRISPCWIHPRFGLLRVISRHQLGLHIWDLVLFTNSPYSPTLYVDTVARISSSSAYDYFLNKYDYSVPQSSTFWSSIDYFNNSYDYFRLVQQLVWLLPTTSTTHTTTSCVTMTRYYITYFGPSQPCIVLGLKPRLRTSPPSHPQP